MATIESLNGTPNGTPASGAQILAARERPHVLVVDDDPDLASVLDVYLSERGFLVSQAHSAEAALKTLAATPVDVIITDVCMPQMTGFELLQHVRERVPDADMLLVTAHSSVKDAVQAIQAGAADYIEKPVDLRRLHHTVQMIIERRRLRHRVRILELSERPTEFEGMVAKSRRMLEIFSFIERLARYPTTALITGESGTGKELVARALHRRSPLADRPFVICNCSALSPGLIESELFGHVKGAFTGADRDHKGLFEAANGGTIFLDEIGELPASAQVKLLRVLENREIRRVGSPVSMGVDIRVVAATNRNLAQMARAGEFREDLFYRLNVGLIELPPLRERLDDVELLCQHFMRQFTEKLGVEDARLSPAAFDAFQRYHWPGNIRELSNILERALIVARGAEIGCDHLPGEIRAPAVGSDSASPEEEFPGDLSLRAAEREQIRRALDSAGGRRVAAARMLGLSRRTLYRKLDKYGIR